MHGPWKARNHNTLSFIGPHSSHAPSLDHVPGDSTCTAAGTMGSACRNSRLFKEAVGPLIPERAELAELPCPGLK